MGSLRVGHDWATERLSDFTFPFSTGEGNGNPLQCSCLENPRDREAWWAAIYGLVQSRTRLKWLSSSSSSSWLLTPTQLASLCWILGTFWTQGPICIVHSLNSFTSFPQISLSQWDHLTPLYVKLYPPYLLLIPYWPFFLLLNLFYFF